MSEVLVWWLSIEVLGLLTFPLTFAFFSGLADRGYSLAKVVGLVLLGYGLWLGATVGVVPNGRGAVLFLLLVLGLLSLGVILRQRRQLGEFLRGHLSYVLLVEGLFTASLMVAAWLRATVPDIAGTEKPMEVLLLNGVARADTFPPGDPWLSGSRINYYYFGYLMTASQIELTGVSTSVGFNLGLVLIVALSVSAAFGIGYNLVQARLLGAQFPSDSGSAGGRPLASRAIAVGVLAVVLLFIYSNYVGVIELAAIKGLDWPAFYSFFDINGLDGPRVSETWYPSEFWFWWRASRLYCEGCPTVISEFPFFSFLLGDFHPHVIAIPFTLLIVAVGWQVLNGPEREGWPWQRPGRFLLLAVLVGSTGFLHTWNLPIVSLLVTLVYGFRRFRAAGGLTAAVVGGTLAFAGALAVISWLAYVPFWGIPWLAPLYETPAEGLRVTDGPATRPIHLFLHWGLFLLLPTVLALRTIGSGHQGWRFTPGQWLTALGAAAAPLLVWAVAFAVAEPVGQDVPQQWQGWLTAVWLVGTQILLVLALLRLLSTSDRLAKEGSIAFALVLASLGVLLLVGSELFFIRDVFAGRMNTVFKLWYVAWLFLGLSSAFSAWFLLQEWRPREWWANLGRSAVLAASLVLLLAGLVYPLMATLNRTDGLEGPRTLDGLAFIRPEEREAIRWLRQVEGRPVIMEATGDSFSEASRVSAYTGLPTVLGWAGHERQWRGSYEPQGTRKADVDAAYNTTDVAEAQAVLDKYDVEYVYVGHIERQAYSPQGLEKFRQFMDIVFQNGEVTIYQRREPSALVSGP